MVICLAVSADNAFLVLSCWRNTHPLISIEERVAQSVGGTSVSIMITALTDGLSFAVGSVSQFPAVRKLYLLSVEKAFYLLTLDFLPITRGDSHYFIFFVIK